MLWLAKAHIGEAQTNVTNYCSPHSSPTPLIKGEPTYVCININNNMRTLFMPKADEFTVLRVSNSFADSRITGDAKGSFVSVSSLSARTTYKQYTSSNGRVYPVLTAIVSVKKGEVQGITWDDGCHVCDASSCEQNLFAAPTTEKAAIVEQDAATCFKEKSACAGENSTSCDITLYIGWTGTDHYGNYLSSAGLRISQFQKYSLSSYWISFKDKFSVFLPSSRFDD